MDDEYAVFGEVKFEKARAIARYNRFRKMGKLFQVLEVLVVFAVLSWCFPAVLKFYFFKYMFNHHVVFLMGNVIIVLLVVLCRQNDAGSISTAKPDFYDEYAKHRDTDSGGGAGNDAEKQIVVPYYEDNMDEVSSQCDDNVLTAIETATRQIRRCERAQSERWRRELRRKVFGRSETDNSRAIVTSGNPRTEAAEIDNLSNEEFQRRVDAFIEKHWKKKIADELN